MMSLLEGGKYDIKTAEGGKAFSNELIHLSKLLFGFKILRFTFGVL